MVKDKDVVSCPECENRKFILVRERLSNRMLASKRLRVICDNCGYEESLYRIGENRNA